jgi:microsomal dipeptidase-like Zn-dependent dipeptidase
MLTTAIDSHLGVVDLHCHPSMMSYNYGNRFWKAHNPPTWFWPWTMRTDFDALLAGGVKTFLCTAYVLERTMFEDVWPLRALAAVYPRARHMATTPIRDLTFEFLDTAEQMVEETRRRRGDVIEFGRTFSEMQRITGEGKICMLHAVEGAHHLDGDLGMVDKLFERGVCQMIVPHLYPNEACGCLNVFDGMHLTGKLGCFSPKLQSTAGLTAWGRDLIEKLLDVGILVDPTHGTRELRSQVFDIVRSNSKKRPVVMSHACVPCPSPEGMGPAPEEIRQIADTGGVVGVMMYTHRDPGQGGGDGVQYAVNAIGHLVQHGGEEVVAIGSDFDGTPDAPKDLKSPRAYSNLREALLRKYSEGQVAKFLSSNAERVLENGWGRH